MSVSLVHTLAVPSAVPNFYSFSKSFSMLIKVWLPDLLREGRVVNCVLRCARLTAFSGIVGTHPEAAS